MAWLKSHFALVFLTSTFYTLMQRVHVHFTQLVSWMMAMNSRKMTAVD
jgi:hypothetical protein